MAYFFISYSTLDRDLAVSVSRGLQRHGRDAWINITDIAPGQSYRDKIDAAIRKASGVIVIVTPNSSASRYVTFEWSYALGCGVPVIPVLMKPTRNLHPRLEAMHHVDALKRFQVSKLLQALKPLARESRAAAAPARSSASQPRIFAKFKMNGSRPVRNGREYELIIGTKHVPEGTRRVRYEILNDETVEDPVWWIPRGVGDFEDNEVSLYGEVYLVAKGKGSDGRWEAQARLTDALRFGHGRQIARSPALRKALTYIATH